MKNDEQLLDMFQKVISGLESKENLSDLIEDQVFALVMPVMKTEKRRDEVAIGILMEICSSVEEFDLQKNIRRQIARFTSVYLYNYLIDQGMNLQTKGELLEYEYVSVKEDQELHNAVKSIVKIFRDSKLYKKADRRLKNLGSMEVVLIELFAYETYSIDQLEDMLEVDSVFLCNAIQRAKCALLGIEIEVDDEQDFDVDENEDEDKDEDEDEGSILEDIYERTPVKQNKWVAETNTDEDENLNLDKWSSDWIRRVFPKLDNKYIHVIQCGIITGVLVLIIGLVSCTVKSVSPTRKKEESTTIETTASEEMKEQTTTAKKKQNATTAAQTTTTQAPNVNQNAQPAVQENTVQNTEIETTIEETTEETTEETVAEPSSDGGTESTTPKDNSEAENGDAGIGDIGAGVEVNPAQ